ncbi:translation initiation factor IF-2 [Hylobates moloch]|uniref:translation initiation factor IF-2 n=1 Tax=Hylobates moloch TaxID=81572 RepID=UPI002674F1BB|nr:translation initiation factor IF-2 [Hylobates moloch]
MRPSFNPYGGKCAQVLISTVGKRHLQQNKGGGGGGPRVAPHAVQRHETNTGCAPRGRVPSSSRPVFPRGPLLRADPTSSGRGALPLVARRAPSPDPRPLGRPHRPRWRPNRPPSATPAVAAPTPSRCLLLPTAGWGRGRGGRCGLEGGNRGREGAPLPRTARPGPPRTDRLGTAQAPGGERRTPQLRSATPRSRRPRLLLSRVLLATSEARLPPRPLLDAASWPRPLILAAPPSPPRKSPASPGSLQRASPWACLQTRDVSHQRAGTGL